MANILYLHGFASSPQSRKAQWFRRRFESDGARLSIPDLEGGDFTGLTVSGMLERVQPAAVGGQVTLMGSSLGGYAAASYAAMWPDRVDRLILMAPAFDFARRWLDRLGAEAAGAWRRSGMMRVTHYCKGVETDVGWGLIEDALGYPAKPQPPQPALVFHGAGDEVVPVDAARQWCAGHSNRRLVVYDDGHELGRALDPMWIAIQTFLGLLPRRTVS